MNPLVMRGKTVEVKFVLSPGWQAVHVSSENNVTRQWQLEIVEVSRAQLESLARALQVFLQDPEDNVTGSRSAS